MRPLSTESSQGDSETYRRRVPSEPTILAERFARRVRAELERRAEAGRPLSINRLADFAGLGRGYLSELLRLDKQPTLRTVEKIATALEMDPR